MSYHGLKFHLHFLYQLAYLFYKRVHGAWHYFDSVYQPYMTMFYQFYEFPHIQIRKFHFVCYFFHRIEYSSCQNKIHCQFPAHLIDLLYF